MLTFSKKKNKKKGGPIHPSKDIYFMIPNLSSRAHPMQSGCGYRIQSLIQNFSEGQDKPKEIYNLL
jgi:hypothetical protein